MKNLALFLIVAVGILSAAELAAILTTTSPEHASRDVFWAFFCSIFLFLSSLLSLAWYGIKKFLIYRYTTPSLWSSVRQASLFSLILVLCAFFNSLGILSIWDSVPLLLSAILIEFFFQADKTAPESRHGIS